MRDCAPLLLAVLRAGFFAGKLPLCSGQLFEAEINADGVLFGGQGRDLFLDEQ
jgi:hypothetical protein